MSKRANGEGSKPRKKPNGRYEARATIDTPTGRKRVSFYGATAKEAAEKRTAAVAYRNRGTLFSAVPGPWSRPRRPAKSGASA